MERSLDRCEWPDPIEVIADKDNAISGLADYDQACARYRRDWVHRASYTLAPLREQGFDVHVDGP